MATCRHVARLYKRLYEHLSLYKRLKVTKEVNPGAQRTSLLASFLKRPEAKVSIRIDICIYVLIWSH